MSATIYADVVVGIPFGHEGKKRWRKVGVILKHDGTQDRGPGLSIMLDRDFNPAGVPASNDGNSLGLHVFWPNDKTPATGAPETGKAFRPAPAPSFDGPDDDIPF